MNTLKSKESKSVKMRAVKIATVALAAALTTTCAIRGVRAAEQMEVRHYIGSLKRQVKTFARAVCGHWRIENSLHWSLDMTFREDESRIRGRHVAENIAWPRRIALSPLKQHPGKESLAMKRRMAGWSRHFLIEVLAGKAT